MKVRLLLAALCLSAQSQPKYIPTKDFVECRVEKTRQCYNDDIGTGEGNRFNNFGRISDYSTRNIYHDVFTYEDGVMYIERPVKVVESWRTATDSTTEKMPDGTVKTCRHSACIIEEAK